MSATRRWKIIGAAGCLSAAGALPFNFAPVIFGSAADSFGFLPNEIGYMSSIFLFMFALSIVLTYWLQEKVSWHSIMYGGPILGGVAMVAMAASSSSTAWYIGWAIVGLCFGPVFSIVVPILAKQEESASAFGGKLALETGIPALLLLTFPILVTPFFGYVGVAVGSLVALAFMAWSAILIPRSEAATTPSAAMAGVTTEKKPRNTGMRAAIIWIGIVTICIYFGGQISTWIFVERSAKILDYGDASIGLLLFLGKSGAMVGAIAAMVLGFRLGRLTPHWVSFVVLMIGQILLLLAPSYFAFMSGAFLFEFGWAFLVPYLMADIGEIDVTGKLIIFVPAAQALGGAYGPALAGNLVTTSDYSNVFIFGMTTAVICVAIFTILSRYRARLLKA
jgi:MFS family permease